jgi:UDP-N-acetylmuramoyl-tripeptide--D-alanyl-D-alanine ligase
MEALQASALPLGYATEIGKIMADKALYSQRVDKKLWLTYTIRYLFPDGFMSQYTLADIASWLDLPDTLSPLPVRRVASDSKKIEKGDLFVALKGQRVDGHSFLEEVAKNGAVAALVLKNYSGPDFGLILIRVDDVVCSLQKMAKRWREIFNPRIIAVTGSVGKTTTKDFIATLLSARYRVAKSTGNANSQVGLPIAILNCAKDNEFLVQEMAMSEPGNIAKLVTIAPPEIAVITKIGHSHVASFANGLEGVAAAKAEILSHPETKWCIAYKDSARFSSIENGGSCNKFFLDFETPQIELPFTAKHLIEDFVLAVQIAKLLGVSQEEIANKAKELSTYKNRFELIEKEGVFFLNDSYNASPESTKAALENLPKKSGKRIFAFGGCPELGIYHEAKHREIAEVALLNIDHLLCLGEELLPMVDIFEKNQKPVELFKDFETFKKRIFALAKKDDLVLLKSMNTKQLWRVLE